MLKPQNEPQRGRPWQNKEFPWQHIVDTSSSCLGHNILIVTNSEFIVKGLFGSKEEEGGGIRNGVLKAPLKGG